jgi:hypothetical protein
MLFQKIFLFIFMFVLMNATLAGAEDDDCLYNKQAIKRPAFLKDTEFIKVKWSDKNKVAHVVTKQNETIVFKYSACKNLGISAELSLKAKDVTLLTQEYVSTKIIWLAKKIIENNEDMAEIKKSVLGTEFNSFFINGLYNGKEVLLDVPSEHYTELIFGVKHCGNKLYVNWNAISY